MKQIFVDQNLELHQRIGLDEEQAHHLFDVLRIEKKKPFGSLDPMLLF